MAEQIYGIILLIVGIYLMIVAILNKHKFFVTNVTTSQKGIADNYKRIATATVSVLLLLGAYILFTDK